MSQTASGLLDQQRLFHFLPSNRRTSASLKVFNLFRKMSPSRAKNHRKLYTRAGNTGSTKKLTAGKVRFYFIIYLFTYFKSFFNFYHSFNKYHKCLQIT